MAFHKAVCMIMALAEDDTPFEVAHVPLRGVGLMHTAFGEDVYPAVAVGGISAGREVRPHIVRTGGI